MKRLLFIILGFAAGLGPLWLTLSREPAKPKEENREISSEPSKDTNSFIELQKNLQIAKHCQRLDCKQSSKN